MTRVGPRVPRIVVDDGRRVGVRPGRTGSVDTRPSRVTATASRVGGARDTELPGPRNHPVPSRRWWWVRPRGLWPNVAWCGTGWCRAPRLQSRLAHCGDHHRGGCRRRHHALRRSGYAGRFRRPDDAHHGVQPRLRARSRHLALPARSTAADGSGWCSGISGHTVGRSAVRKDHTISTSWARTWPR